MICRNTLLTVLTLALSAPMALGQGLLIPTDKSIPPLAISYQRVNVTIKDQAAVTRVEQQFENESSMALEAYYVFPVPAGAGVDDFAMWIDGKRTAGEVVEAKSARKIYEDIVRRMKDPGLLEHIGENLYRVRVYPVPAKGKQKIEISFSQIVKRDGGITEYVYPLKVCGSARRTKQDFTVRVELESSVELKSVYSPSHDVGVSRDGARKAVIGFEAKNHDLAKDFQLFWTVGDQEVGLSMLTHRESKSEDGYFLALISPSTALDTEDVAPRDVVFVIDTSGSMKGEKLEQAKRALQFCLKSLNEKDRFGILGFATTTNLYDESLQAASKQEIEKGARWCGELEAAGGTAIHDALQGALALRTDESRNFTIVFLTDGQPTIGETSVPAILKMVKEKNQGETRIFVFGVGDDVNTHLLDQVADETRATTVYVRPQEDLEVKVSSFYGKISHPVMTNLQLSLATDDIRLKEIYPPRLPDLFHGGQLVVLGRYQGSGQTALKLSGKIGSEQKELAFDTELAAENKDNRFVVDLWARRKIGYLLDQIRLQGENKELVDEVIGLAKKHNIATPYTSYLVVPDEKEVARLGFQLGRGGFGGQGGYGGGGFGRDAAPGVPGQAESRSASGEMPELQRRNAYRETDLAAAAPEALREETGARSVDVAQSLAKMKSATAQDYSGSRRVGGSTFVPQGGVWIDAAYKEGAEIVKIAYLSDAYFRLVELVPQAREVLALGERIVWQTPSGKLLVIDAEGKDSLEDEEILALFRSGLNSK